jgi:hypothetical protein
VVGPGSACRGRLRGRQSAALGLFLALVASGCAGPAGSPVAPSPAGSSDASSPPASSDAGPAGSPRFQPQPTGFTGGTATALVTLSGGSIAYAGGSCEHGPGDAWLAVNIGDPNGTEYFGLIAGRSPYGSTDVRTAAGGGTLTGDAVLVTYRHAGATHVLDHDSASVDLATDVAGGTFSGHLADGSSVTGTFAC